MLLWDFWNLLFLLRLEGGKAHELSLRGNFCTWQKSRLLRSGGLAQANSRECDHLQLFGSGPSNNSFTLMPQI